MTVGVRFLREFEEGRKAKRDSDEKADGVRADNAAGAVADKRDNGDDVNKAEQQDEEVGLSGASDVKHTEEPEVKISSQSLASIQEPAQLGKDGGKTESAA